MSGGSYNYLCRQDVASLLENSIYDEELDSMHARLQELGATVAAADTMSVLKTVRRLRDHTENLQSSCLGIELSKLQRLWCAVEWRDSNDIGDAALLDARREYLRDRSERTRVVPLALPVDELNALVRRLSTEVETDGDDRLVKTGIERLMAALASTGTVKR